MQAAHDPLDGYRGSPSLTPEEELAQDQDFLRRERETGGIDMELIRDVLRAEELLLAIGDDSSTMKRLMTHVAHERSRAVKALEMIGDIASPEAKSAHGTLRAAKLVFDWANHVYNAGRTAKAIIEEQEAEDHEG
jgi:hypothetical protein